jgi:hypothetical protein
MMRRIVMLLILVPLLPATALAAEEHPSKAKIAIRDQVIKPYLDPYDYCCANWIWTSYTHTLRHIFSTPAHYREFIRFLRDDVSIRTFRYPAGGNVRFVHFGIPGSHFIDEMKKSDPPARADDWIELEEFFKFLEDGDFRTFFQLNTATWYDETSAKMVPFIPAGTKLPAPKEAIDPEGLLKAADRIEHMAHWIKAKNYDRLVRIWEIGNEEYGGYTGEAYALIAAEFTRRIKKVLPDARIVVTNQLGVTKDEWKEIHNTFSLGVLKELNAEKVTKQITGVTNHIYAFAASPKDGALTQTTPQQEFASNISLLADDPYRHPWERLFARDGKPISVIGKQAEMLNGNGFHHADIFITEYRLGGMHELYNQSLANGIGNLHFTASLLAAPRVGGTTIHSLMHASAVTRGNPDTAGQPRPFGIWGYDIINYQMDNDLQPRFVSTPVAEAFNLLWKLAQGDVLQSSSSTPQLFSVATTQDKVLRLLVINESVRTDSDGPESGETFQATIALPTGISTSKNISISTLGARQPLAMRSVDPNTFNVHEAKVKHDTLITKPAANEFEYAIPPHAAVLFEITAQ